MKRLTTLYFLTLALVMAGCSGGETTAGTTGTTGGKPDSDKKLVVGFSQIGAESDWRTANTNSIKEEAEKRGIDLRFSDAQGNQENQIKAIRGYIAQGVDVIAFSPVIETGWKDVLQEAKDANIPVIVSDRRPDVDEDLYVTFIGADFVKEGEEAAKWLATKMNGKAVIAELTGTSGSAPANDRAKGFRDGLAAHPDMKIVYTQTGNFEQAKGKEVMEALLKSPQGATINAVYAHNDNMALGAIEAIKAAGKKPGTDIIIVSIDAIKGAFEAIERGELNCTIECNPLLGPFLFDAIDKVMKGETLEKRQIIPERVFDATNAVEELPNRKY